MLLSVRITPPGSQGLNREDRCLEGIEAPRGVSIVITPPVSVTRGTTWAISLHRFDFVRVLFLFIHCPGIRCSRPPSRPRLPRVPVQEAGGRKNRGRQRVRRPRQSRRAHFRSPSSPLPDEGFGVSSHHDVCVMEIPSVIQDRSDSPAALHVRTRGRVHDFFSSVATSPLAPHPASALESSPRPGRSIGRVPAF